MDENLDGWHHGVDPVMVSLPNAVPGSRTEWSTQRVP